MGVFFPTLVAGLGWGDWKGGYVYAGLVRLVFVHHVSMFNGGRPYAHIRSQPFVSTRLHIGWARRLSMTNILLVTIWLMTTTHGGTINTKTTTTLPRTTTWRRRNVTGTAGTATTMMRHANDNADADDDGSDADGNNGDSDDSDTDSPLTTCDIRDKGRPMTSRI